MRENFRSFGNFWFLFRDFFFFVNFLLIFKTFNAERESLIAYFLRQALLQLNFVVNLLGWAFKVESLLVLSFLTFLIA